MSPEPTVPDTAASYDRVAAEYVQRVYGELEHKPLDRELLDRLVHETSGRGPLCDLGCGPGHITRYLHDRGADVFGLDLSPGMLAQARAQNPELSFQQGDMRALDAPDDAWAGIAACYSLIHIPRAEVTAALRELKRVLRPEGLLLASFHIGSGVRHLDEWWGQRVSVDFTFFEPDEMAGYMRAAGLTVVDVIVREPYPDVETQTRRAYIFAQKPATRAALA